MLTLQQLDGISVIDVHVDDLPDAMQLPVTCPENKGHRQLLEDEMKREDARQNKQWRGGVRSLDEALQLLVDGWPEGVERCERLAADLAERLPVPRSRVRRKRWGQDGELDVDALFAERYETMFVESHREVQMGTAATIGIVASWGGNGGLRADQLFWTGGAMVALSNLLEGVGLNTACYLADVVGWYGKGVKQITLLRAKEPGDPLVLDTLVVAAAHPSTYRSIGFALSTLMPFDVTSSYGQARELEEGLPTLLRHGVVEAAQVTVPKLRSEREARSFLLKAVEHVEQANLHALGEEVDT